MGCKGESSKTPSEKMPRLAGEVGGAGGERVREAGYG